MDKIKKQFKDFWAYCRLLKYGANTSDRARDRKYFAFLIVVFFGIMTIIMQISAGGEHLTFSIFLPFLCGMSIATGVVTAYRPSLLSVSPYTPKQRIVFSYLATLLRAIVVTVIWTVCVILAMLFFAFLAFIISGENILVVEEGEESVVRAISAYGTAHEVLTWVIMIFAAYAISHINGRKARNIATACFFVGIEVLVLILVNACEAAKYAYLFDTGVYDGLIQAFTLGSAVQYTIDYLAHPWVVIVVEAVLCVAAIAASAVTSVMRYKSSKI